MKFLFLLTSSCSLFASVAHATLISQYTFDDIAPAGEPGSYYLNDSSPANGNQRLYMNGTPSLIDGVDGKALWLGNPPAHGTYSAFSDNAGFMTNVPAVSILGWVKVEALPQPWVDVAVISMLSVKGNPWNSRFVVALNSKGQLEVGGRAWDSDPYHSVYTQNALSLNQWIHIAGVIDYQNNSVDVYIDGQKQDLTGAFSGFAHSASGTTTGDYFRLGASGIGGGGEYFQGGLDDLRFYDEALSPETIKSLSVVPEPSAGGLLGLVATGAAAWRRRRN